MNLTHPDIPGSSLDVDPDKPSTAVLQSRGWVPTDADKAPSRDDRVDALVSGNDRARLDDLAVKAGIDPDVHTTKTDLAEAIVDGQDPNHTDS